MRGPHEDFIGGFWEVSRLFIEVFYKWLKLQVKFGAAFSQQLERQGPAWRQAVGDAPQGPGLRGGLQAFEPGEVFEPAAGEPSAMGVPGEAEPSVQTRLKPELEPPVQLIAA